MGSPEGGTVFVGRGTPRGAWKRQAELRKEAKGLSRGDSLGIHVAMGPGWDCARGMRPAWQEARSPHQHAQRMQVPRGRGCVWGVASKFPAAAPTTFQDLGSSGP